MMGLRMDVPAETGNVGKVKGTGKRKRNEKGGGGRGGDEERINVGQTKQMGGGAPRASQGHAAITVIAAEHQLSPGGWRSDGGSTSSYTVLTDTAVSVSQGRAPSEALGVRGAARAPRCRREGECALRESSRAALRSVLGGGSVFTVAVRYAFNIQDLGVPRIRRASTSPLAWARERGKALAARGVGK